MSTPLATTFLNPDALPVEGSAWAAWIGWVDQPDEPMVFHEDFEASDWADQDDPDEAIFTEDFEAMDWGESPNSIAPAFIITKSKPVSIEGNYYTDGYQPFVTDGSGRL